MELKNVLNPDIIVKQEAPSERSAAISQSSSVLLAQKLAQAEAARVKLKQTTDLLPAILKQLSDNYNISVTPKRKDDTQKHRRASNSCKLAVREVYKALARTDQSFGFELGRD
uniref:Uncharacterized protein n=1 Tax=Magallana gigas TaxID=29159 RepID=A0A8W8MIR7_MAGGI